MTTSSSRALWDRYREFLCVSPSLGMTLDISRMRFGDDYLAKMEPAMQKAFAAMDAIEAGAIANPDEQRRVGHYWLRDASRAPAELRPEITHAVQQVQTFAAAVHSGKIAGHGGTFTDLLVIGIGGSALGPELVADALGTNHDRLTPHFFDNTDPDGMDRVLGALGPKLATTLTVVISKSGGTKETRNGMLEAKAAYEKLGLDFARHATAVTGVDSDLDKVAVRDKWLERFPMWDWIGGRTSEMSTVGLVPAALQGIAIEEMLDGAKLADEVTRVHDTKKNPAALLALMWFFATDGKGHKDMVILPYKDRLLLFSRYLQQLVMESLGKEKDLDGKVVHQGIAVYGNKGSTDQHAYVQQLREGVPNFFVTFVEVLQDRQGPSLPMEDGATSGDYLIGFLQGTRRALYENGRDSITLSLDQLNPRSLGALIALYERAVGFYGSLVNVNAYHQPGVEAGKKAATAVLSLQKKLLAWLDGHVGQAYTVEELATAMGVPDEVETLFKVVMHAGFNPDHGIERAAGATPFDTKFSKGAAR